MRRLFASVFALVVLLTLVPAAAADDAFVTLGVLPVSTKKESWTIRGTAPRSQTVGVWVNGELQVRVVSGPSMDRYLADVTLSPGENAIEVRLEGTEARAEGSIVRVTKAFKDLEKHWAKEDCEFLATLGIVNGMGNDEFGPDQPLTRAQFAKLVVLGLKLQADPAPVLSFTDDAAIPEWAKGFVATAVAKGLIKGFDDGSFRPDEQVSRAQVAVIAARGLRHKGIQSGSGKGRAFTDNAKIPAWATADVEFTATAGLIGEFWGEAFDANTSATRGLAAAVVRRLYSAK
ncbi:MAG TPA: S-layer homology domain-containing protein [Symbiobacteriaceae bacterium]|nr:S-layer homology domain-containing protein [Symbiobacteriaceae bacterium]